MAQILFASKSVNDAACSEEEQGFEEGMSHQMKDAGRVGAQAHSEKHVA